MWERLCGTVKRAARKTCGKKVYSRDQLTTILCQLEDAINRRPLVVSEDGSTLTPAHFLFGASPPPLEVGPILPPMESDGRALEKMVRIRRQGADHLWRRWTREYLVTLRQWRQPSNRKPGKRPFPG